MPVSTRFIAFFHGVIFSTTSSGGVSETLPSSIASKSFSLMELQSRSFTCLTSQAFAKLLFHAIQLSLDGALGHSKLRRYLGG